MTQNRLVRTYQAHSLSEAARCRPIRSKIDSNTSLMRVEYTIRSPCLSSNSWDATNVFLVNARSTTTELLSGRPEYRGPFVDAPRPPFAFPDSPRL